MNILYIGDFDNRYDNGRACSERADALEKAGATVVRRHVGEHQVKYQSPPKVDGFDCVIQHAFPRFFAYDADVGLNVAEFDYELDNFTDANLKKQLNHMDLCLVASNHSVEAYEKSGVTSPIVRLDYPTKKEYYTKEYEVPVYLKDLINRKAFIFYTILPEKNIQCVKDLILAYYTEFSDKDNVVLIIKSELSSGNLKEAVESEIQKLNWRSAPEMIFVLDQYTLEQKFALHQHASCYIDTNYGKNWSYDTLDALCFGKTPIVPESTSFVHIVNESTGYLIKTDLEPCRGIEDVWGGTYRCNQHWRRPLISSIKKHMRNVFSYQDSLAAKRFAGVSDVLRFGYEELGVHLLEVLSHAKKKKLEAP